MSTVSGGATNISGRAGPGESRFETYKIFKPGISPQAANQLALSMLRRISTTE